MHLCNLLYIFTLFTLSFGAFLNTDCFFIDMELTGFHGHLSLLSNCTSSSLLLVLPSSFYIDSFELIDSPDYVIHHYRPSDIESSSFLSKAQSVYLFNRHVNNHITLPIHVRYHEPSCSEKYLLLPPITVISGDDVYSDWSGSYQIPVGLTKHKVLVNLMFYSFHVCVLVMFVLFFFSPC
ncbi:hypothetical protein GEMRC1_001312 [Eukaryota sp. GEM-RC1]